MFSVLLFFLNQFVTKKSFINKKTSKIISSQRAFLWKTRSCKI